MKPSVVKLLSIFLFFFILVTTNQSCKKLKDDIQVKNEIQIVKHPLEDQFFTIPDSVPDVVKKIAASIKSRKNKSAIAANILAEVGLPVWDKSLLIMPSNAVNQKTNRNAGTSIDSSYIFVPVVTIGTKEVEGALACLVVGDSVTIKFLKEKDYRQYGFNTNNPKNAESLVGLMMYLQNKAYGTTSFVVNDERLIYGDAPYADSTQKALIHFEAVSNTLNRESKNKTAIAALYAEVQVCYAYDYYGCSNPAHWGQVCGELDKIGYHTINRCQSYTIWLGGGGSDTYNPPTSGGGTSGSVSTQTYLKQILGLTDQEAVIFESYPGLGDETYNYCNNSDGQFTELERKKLAISHTLLLGTNPEYTDYCAMRYEENASLKGKKFPWFRMLSLQDEYPDLASNIQLLKLNAQQAYYLWNNSLMNTKINNYCINNNGQSLSDKEAAVKSHINGILTNPSYVTFVNNYEATDNTGKMWWENDAWININYPNQKIKFDLETGDKDNNTDGGFDNTTYQEFNPINQSWPTINNVIPNSDFVGWGTNGITRNCMSYAKAQIAKKGYQISNYNATGQTFQIYTSINGPNKSVASSGVSYLISALQRGIPIIVGVDDQPGSANPATDNTTDHFIVIVGMGTDANGNYFTFFDNSSGLMSQGTNVNNKLYYNPSTGIIKGKSQTDYANGLNDYIVTMIRKSK